MVATQTLETQQDELVYVPLDYLALAPENTRQEPDPEALEALKASIREQGLLQNLVGYEAGERVLVVAGGHRLRALQALAAEGHPVPDVPVRLVSREKALLLSVTENLQRKDLTPLEEAEAVASLQKAGLSPEAIAKELGRSLAFVRGRLQVAQSLSPSWRKALHERQVPFALALELAELPEKEQEELWAKHGPALKPESVRGMKLREAVPAKRLLPGVRERYLEAGGTIEATLEGEEHLTDRPLALRLQEEAARALAERLKAELLLDLPPHRVVQAPMGEGKNLVVLNTSTLEVRTFISVRLVGEKLEEAKSQEPGPVEEGVAEEGEEDTGEACACQEGVGTEPKAATPPAPTAGPAQQPQTLRPEVTIAGAAERVGLRVRAARERALRDEAYAKAALVLGTLDALFVSGNGAGYFRHKGGSDVYGYQLHVEVKRWQEISGENALRGRLEGILKGAGLEPQKTKVEDLMALPEETLDEAFRLSLALLIALPPAKEPPVPTLGMVDAEHLSAFSEPVLDEALKELGVQVGAKAKKKDKVASLLLKRDAPYPKALMQAKSSRG